MTFGLSRPPKNDVCVALCCIFLVKSAQQRSLYHPPSTLAPSRSKNPLHHRRAWFQRWQRWLERSVYLPPRSLLLHSPRLSPCDLALTKAVGERSRGGPLTWYVSLPRPRFPDSLTHSLTLLCIHVIWALITPLSSTATPLRSLKFCDSRLRYPCKASQSY